MKKLFALLLAVLMVISMAACAANEPATTTAPKATTPAATQPAGTTAAATTTEPAKDMSALPFVEPGSVKLTIGIKSNATVLDYHDNYTTKYLEEKTGVDIDFVFFSSDSEEAKQQLNLMVASKEKLPDIMLEVVNDKGQAKELGDDGFLADISDLFADGYAYWTDRALTAMTPASTAKIWAACTNEDGSIYLFPRYSMSVGVDQSEYMLGLNETMAAKFGMKAEEIDTVAEVYEFLKKAVKEDGNGNGQPDEIGFVIRGQDAYRGNGFLWVINAYVLMNDTYLFNVTDGELWSPYVTDEYREALIELNKWYKEGLISPLSWSIASDGEMKELVHNPEKDNVALFGGHPTLVTDTNGVRSKDAGAMYDSVKILKDETGLGGYGVLRDPDNIAVPVAFSADCENLEVAFRLVDFMNEDHTQHVMRYGEEGVNWEHIDGEAEGLKDNQNRWAGMRVLKDEWSTETKATWHTNPMYFTGNLAYSMGMHHGSTPYTLSETSRGAISYGCRWEWETHTPEEFLYHPIFNGEEQEVIDQYRTNLRNYIRESRAQFMSGAMDPNNDADWQKFLDGLVAEGHDDVMEAYQDAYTRMVG